MPRRLALWPLVLPFLALAACAAPETKPTPLPFVVSANDLPPIPVCRDEMVAFVELNRLAKIHGEEWVVFEPAITAMKQQILDCMDENAEELPQL